MKCWPIIRHIRALYLSYRVERWARYCASMGLGLGRPNEADLRYIQAVWKGEA